MYMYLYLIDTPSLVATIYQLSFWIKFVMIHFHCLILIQFGDGYIQVKKKENVHLGSHKGDCVCYIHVTAFYMSTLQKIKGKIFTKLSGAHIIWVISKYRGVT